MMNARVRPAARGIAFSSIEAIARAAGSTPARAADAVRALNRLLDQRPDLLAHEEWASVREWE